MGRVRCQLATLVLFLTVAATIWGAVVTSSTSYAYDGVGSTRAALGMGVSVQPADLQQLSVVEGSRPLWQTYDDSLNVARASARQGGHRPAPRSVTGVADDLGMACRSNSFVPATLVLLADGTTQPIEDVQIGDVVMATDPETGERGPRRVTDTIVGDGIKELVDIEIDGNVITATDRHPFWVDDEGRWVDAEDLQAGDVLLLADGDTVTVDAVRERTEARRVHNLTVDGIHTYYVLAGDDPVLVHNCVDPYDVGTFRQLDNASLSGDDLAIHHVGQHHAAAQVVPGHTYRGGPAIALPTAEHALIPNLRGVVNLTPRQLLARDIWNLRTYTNAPNSALRQLIDLNRQTYPGVF